MPETSESVETQSAHASAITLVMPSSETVLNTPQPPPPVPRLPSIPRPSQSAVVRTPSQRHSKRRSDMEKARDRNTFRGVFDKFVGNKRHRGQERGTICVLTTIYSSVRPTFYAPRPTDGYFYTLQHYSCDACRL